ncbi:maleylacetate reductase [Verminephrobacter eiseniae]|uniref:maleylacetate reductase n=1 Tax=Verminephrobacter eiseniae TaxID=364317 RepID=UPI0010DBCB55|nr:maleylacetate reductase [Verminephrobacter eiseniae]KAB7571658.1 maleylacetate reductase [Verminephrobacter sp. Larva24]MCW5230255.1 maleylacetate reductase [Verminephrobacter eiseniae]MCW5291988.1 maleylacetate reductase [Verminephrobacter eiseniae]MCW8185793.1 maleylacetate reductase [Verminephrobacter eiseniae]MCW8224697.1 maleylacetate reductase [Verminephrobacter eiseniae]
MRDFVYNASPARVVFAPGSRARLTDEVAALGVERALVLCTPNQSALAEAAAALLGERCVGVFDGARMHVPVEVAHKACAYATSLGADGVVALGGGSTIGLAKAIALDMGLPIVAMPTTYAGSEMTPIYGLTEGGAKRTGHDARVLPRTVVYDPELTLALPVALSIASGLNAIAHAAEGLYAHDGNPVLDLMAEEGIRALADGLPRVAVAPHDLAARSDCLYGAWLCGTVLGQAGMALHHKLCHVLGGSLDLPHAQTHAVMLPHTLAYNAPAVPEAMRRIARALGRPEAGRGLHELAKELGAPTALRDLGVTVDALDRVADLALTNPYANPRPLHRQAIVGLLARAWAGAPPEP